MADEIPTSRPAWEAIGVPLLKAFGLSGQRIRALDIRIAVGEPVIVKTEQFARSESGDTLQRVLRRYTLTDESTGDAKAFVVDVTDDDAVDVTDIEHISGCARYERVGGDGHG